MSTQQFLEQANTYKLSMNLENNMLTVVLQDFTEWVIYSKTFADCGKGSKGKMSLREFYECFRCSEVDGLIALRNYKFGTFIKHHEIYGFKIEAGGKLTGYKKD
jgi:hypothetical protein